MKEQYQNHLLVPGHRACPGCTATIAVRAILQATGSNVILASPTGCLEVFTTPYPYSAWGVPWVHSLFENAPAVACGVEAALRVKGKKDTAVVVIGGDGSSYDIGMGAFSGMLERGHNILYVCYDNEAYMNTGVQRSGATPYLAGTTTTPVGKLGFGKVRPKKDLIAIALAHDIPYAATASIAFPRDITRKVERALQIVLPPKNRSDRTCFRNIAKWLMAGCDTGTFNEKVVFRLVLDFALEASGPKSRNPAAVFMSILKKELRYRPGSNSN